MGKIINRRITFKAKTIEKYLGEDYQVKSSFGHVHDLEKGKKALILPMTFNPIIS